MNSDSHGKKYYNLYLTYNSQTRFSEKELKCLIAYSNKQSASQRVKKIFPNVQRHAVCFLRWVPCLRSR